MQQQKRQDQAKVYGVHEPEVMCIARGKAGKKCEVGHKVSVAVTSKVGWLLGAMCAPDNPYDGHTPKKRIQQMVLS